ncbi:hypothetical protein SDC9_118870 [bioreactor metagenome]|uniref:Uncharacterized protein n=1 Tax=bioreactor metagenome TaxID=1076179 RepID=A0A645C2Q4_9ZZZZ
MPDGGLEGAHLGVPADPDRVLTAVDCAGRPVLDGDDIDAGAFVDLYLDLRRQPGYPGALQHDRGLGVMTDGDDHVGGGQFVAAVGGDDHRCIKHGLRGHLDQQRLLGLDGLGRHQVDRRVEREILGGRRVDRPAGDAFGQRRGDGDLAERPVGHQRLEPLDRGESPVLLAPGGHGVIGQLPRRGRVQV